MNVGSCHLAQVPPADLNVPILAQLPPAQFSDALEPGWLEKYDAALGGWAAPAVGVGTPAAAPG